MMREESGEYPVLLPVKDKKEIIEVILTHTLDPDCYIFHLSPIVLVCIVDPLVGSVPRSKRDDVQRHNKAKRASFLSIYNSSPD